jgi:polysaccharide biosynthesis protein PslH
MRILLLAQVVPYPPDSGPKIKTFNVLRYLAQQHEVHVVAFSRSPNEDAAARSLAEFCAGVTTVPLQRSKGRDMASLVRSAATGRPFLVERDDSPRMRRTISQLLTTLPFDAVHADQLTMAQFAEALPVRLRVLDEHNAVWKIVGRAAPQQGVLRPIAELEWRKLRSYEGSVCRRFDQVLVVSEEDRRALEEASGNETTPRVIPIAVDTNEFRFESPKPNARHVLSLGTMFYPPNAEAVLWFARNVFPIVRAASPGSKFFVVGSRPPATVKRLAHPTNGVMVTGYVADIKPVLDQSAVLVVPVRAGSGMRVKILEAFARGVPVVSTSVGIEGIEARAGEHFLLGDDAQTFASAVIHILEDTAAAGRLAQAARKLVERQYDWHTALLGLDEVYGAAA